MSNLDFGRIEAKLSAQEMLINTLQVQIKTLRNDMSASFQQLADYQLMSEQKLDTRFDTIEANMVTKNDLKAELANTESRILSAFQQLVAVISSKPQGRP